MSNPAVIKRDTANTSPTRRSGKKTKTRKARTTEGHEAPGKQPQQQQQPQQQAQQPKMKDESSAPLFDYSPLSGLLNQFDHSQVDESLRLEAIEYLECLLVDWASSNLVGGNEKGAQSDRTATSVQQQQPRKNPWKKQPNPTIVSFGSYRLGVSREESDLDLLVVAPPCITRDDFFTSWPEFLKSKSRIERVHPIPEAYTPVLKLEIDSISVDMLFARLSDASRLQAFHHQQRVPQQHGKSHKGHKGKQQQQQQLPVLQVVDTTTHRKDYRITDADLCNQDEAGIRSLNGARVCQMLIDMVPDLHKFQIVCRAVKEWAVQKGIYSNVLGFLGGVNWAIMVVWVCRYHPRAEAATPAELIAYFFYVFAGWTWPTPLLVEELQMEPPPGVKKMHFWNPMENYRDGLDLCPILTPAYPSMNSAYNVGLSQLRRMQDEFYKAWTMVQCQDYEQLFVPCDFFAQHDQILQVSIGATNDTDFMLWFRLVESRLRFLLNNLETPEIQAWPLSRFYTRQYVRRGMTEPAGREALFFVALKSNLGDDLHKQVFLLTSDFLHKVNSWDKRNERTMSVAIACVPPEELPPSCVHESETEEWDATTSHSSRSVTHDSRSGKITHQTSDGSVDDDSLVSECSGFMNDFSMKRCRVNTSSAVPVL